MKEKYMYYTCLDDKHPDGPARVEQVHGVLVELVEVKRIDPLLGSYQDMLVVCLGMDLNEKVNFCFSAKNL